jgi:hypothetical protein
MTTDSGAVPYRARSLRDVPVRQHQVRANYKIGADMLKNVTSPLDSTNGRVLEFSQGLAFSKILAMYLSRL